MDNTESLNLLPNNSTISLENSNENYGLNTELSTQNNQILFIDSTVEDYQTLIDNLIEPTNVVILDSQQDGIAQITESLSQYDDLNAVHIVSHGNSGELFLGNTILNQDTLLKYENELNNWENAIEEEGDILLYGCNVAADLAGAKFVEELSEYTKADVQASDDITGSNELGGDWHLEYATNDVETTPIFDSKVNSIYQHSLVGVNFSTGLRSAYIRDNRIIVVYESDNNDGNFGEFDNFLDEELFNIDNDDDEELVAVEFNNFANIPASNLIILAENGLNFAEVSPDVLATVDFNNIPAEDFLVLRNAGLSLTPLSSEALANVNLGTFKNFGYLSQVNLSQTQFDNLTLFGELSTTFVSNANLYDYKAELDIGLGIDLDELVQFSLSDFQAVDYAFDGDEIFDFVHYTTQGRNVAGANPFTDYAENGWKEGLDPHPLFDVSFYLSNNTDVRDAGVEPLQHYTTTGFSDPNPNRDPHPLFDTSYYNENNTDVVDANKSSLSHFVESGFSENFNSRDPNQFFDSSYYNANNPDVVAEGVNPLTHYIQFGWRESLPGNLGGTNPNRDPNPLFDTEFYFETHTDVKNEILQDSDFNTEPLKYYNANPLQHYLEFGGEGVFATEERITHPIYEGDNQIAFSSFIDGQFDIDEQSEEFQFVENKFAELNYEITPREEGGILVANPALLLNPVVVSGIKYTIYVGGTYVIGDQLDVPEGVVNLYESFTQTSLYESFSIDLSNLFTGTPPFPDDAIESTPQIETFPRGNTLENLLNLDGRFYTPLDPIDELAENIESFPQRDEILESILSEPLIFPGEQVPTGTYAYPTDTISFTSDQPIWSEGFRNGENENITISSSSMPDILRETEIRQELATPGSGLNRRNRNLVGSGSRNVAFAEYNIGSKNGTIKAVSGTFQVNLDGYAPFAPLINRKLPTYEVDEFNKVLDSEAKILEFILTEVVEPGVTGTIRIVSTNPICASCGQVIEDFIDMVKDPDGNIVGNIIVEVIELRTPR